MRYFNAVASFSSVVAFFMALSVLRPSSSSGANSQYGLILFNICVSPHSVLHISLRISLLMRLMALPRSAGVIYVPKRHSAISVGRANNPRPFISPATPGHAERTPSISAGEVSEPL